MGHETACEGQSIPEGELNQLAYTDWASQPI